MIYHPWVLQKISQIDNFKFIHKTYQDLFDKILEKFMIDENFDAFDLAIELPGEQRSIFYQIIDRDLADTDINEEIDDLIYAFTMEREKIKLKELEQQLENAKKIIGDDSLQTQLTLQIINQKKKL